MNELLNHFIMRFRVLVIRVMANSSKNMRDEQYLSYPLDFDIGVAQSESYDAIPDIPLIFSRREGGTQEVRSFRCFPD